MFKARRREKRLDEIAEEEHPADRGEFLLIGAVVLIIAIGALAWQLRTIRYAAVVPASKSVSVINKSTYNWWSVKAQVDYTYIWEGREYQGQDFVSCHSVWTQEPLVRRLQAQPCVFVNPSRPGVSTVQRGVQPWAIALLCVGLGTMLRGISGVLDFYEFSLGENWRRRWRRTKRLVEAAAPGLVVIGIVYAPLVLFTPWTPSWWMIGASATVGAAASAGVWFMERRRGNHNL